MKNKELTFQVTYRTAQGKVETTRVTARSYSWAEKKIPEGATLIKCRYIEQNGDLLYLH